MAAAGGDVAQQSGTLVEVDHVGDDVAEEVVTSFAQQVQGDGGQPRAVPRAGHASWDPPDLRAADGEAVVVELLPEADPRRLTLVEAEVDDRAGGPERLERGHQGSAVAAALQDHVGAPVPGAVHPPLLHLAPRLAVAVD